jgi:hypothetical protein
VAAWDLGREISGDEQNNGLKGNHQDKQCISYKREGDGFMADTINENGYNSSFYFRNMATPKKNPQNVFTTSGKDSFPI